MTRFVTTSIHKALAALALIAPLAMTACGASASGTVSYRPIHLQMDADRLEFTTPQSMCPSLLTSEVVVASHGQAHWNTSNGQRPPISDSNQILTQAYRIYTPVTFARNQPLIDHRPAPTKEFVMNGGRVGADSIAIDGFPDVQDGRHYIVVFSPALLPTDKGKTADWLVIYDVFPIDAQGMVLLQAATPANEPGPGQPQPEIKLSLTSFKQQLAAC